jgi:hypothetical protein
MHNWFELSAYSRERVSELTRLSESIRTAQELRGSLRLRAKAVEPTRIAPAPEPAASGRDATGSRATFVLERGEVLSIRVGRRPYRIACIAGRLWTTMDGSTVDLVLAAGESLAYQGRGKVVVQALRTATVRVESPSAARVFLSSPLRPAFQLG